VSKPYIGDAEDNYVRISLEDFATIAELLKKAGYEMQPGRKNGRGAQRLFRAKKRAAPPPASLRAEEETDE